MRMTPLRTVLGLALVAALAVACDTEQPTTVDTALGHDHAPVQAFAPGSAEAAAINKAIADLRRATADWHNPGKAEAAGYVAPLGCIDERVMGLSESDARGMGYHVLNPDLLFDGGEVNLYEPELIVYAENPANGKLQIAGFDYFVLGSDVGENDPPPTLLGVEFTWSPMAVNSTGGWMLHTWPWWHNPDGMFENFNPTVPTCGCDPTASYDGDANPDGICFPTE
jgi:hypothetical protein